MVLKFSGDIDELAYPFIFEDSSLCDFEILTDELCTYVGLTISQLADGELRQSLSWLRQLVKVDAEGKKVPETLPRFSNLLVNYFFALTRVLNQHTGIEEPEYISINYPMPDAK